jgi:hypothetical protein
MKPRVRALLFAAALSLFACGSPSNGNDGGTDGGNSACDGTALTPPNLIHNNGFECGGASPAEWGAVFGTLDFPSGGAHTGMRNARITAGSNGDARFAYNPDVIDDGGMAVLCGHAWVKGTTPFMKMRLLVVDGTNVNAFEVSSPGGADWIRVLPSVNLGPAANAGAQKVELEFESQVGRSDGMNSIAGDTLEIDDVDVWISPNGQCHER